MLDSSANLWFCRSVQVACTVFQSLEDSLQSVLTALHESSRDYRPGPPEGLSLHGRPTLQIPYGESKENSVQENHEKAPISIYGASKIASEHLVSTYCRAFQIPYAIVRVSNVYGSHRDIPERVIPKFVAAARVGSRLSCYGGRQILDFTYVGDIVAGLTCLIETLLKEEETVLGEDFHFVTGKGTAVIQLASLIKQKLGSTSEIEIKEPQPFDVKRFVGDPSKTREKLGFYPSTDLNHGLEAYIRELREHESVQS